MLGVLGVRLVIGAVEGAWLQETPHAPLEGVECLECLESDWPLEGVEWRGPGSRRTPQAPLEGVEWRGPGSRGAPRWPRVLHSNDPLLLPTPSPLLGALQCPLPISAVVGYSAYKYLIHSAACFRPTSSWLNSSARAHAATPCAINHELHAGCTRL